MRTTMRAFASNQRSMAGSKKSVKRRVPPNSAMRWPVPRIASGEVKVDPFLDQVWEIRRLLWSITVEISRITDVVESSEAGRPL